MQISTVCLANHEGGAAIVNGMIRPYCKFVSFANDLFAIKDHNNKPGLGLFMWADGSGFETVVNQEMGEMFPYGMDPTIHNDEPELALLNTTSLTELRVGNTSGDVSTA